MKVINIRKSWFYTAGDRFSWSEDGLDKRGLGIARNYLQENKELEVVVDKKHYHLDCNEAVAFIKRYNSKMVINGTTLGVIPFIAFKEIYEKK